MIERRFTCVGIGVLWTLAVVGCTSTPPVQTGDVSSTSVPTTVVQAVAADLAYAENERDLVRQATLIIVGTPTDTTEEISRSSDGAFVHYSQAIRVEEVLKGDDVGKTVKIGRSDFAQQRQGAAVADVVLGPLPPGKHILFLQPSAAPNLFQIVGHTSGDVLLDDNGRTTTTRPEAQAFANLDIAGVRERIAAFSQP